MALAARCPDRSRQYLRPQEVQRLLEASRHPDHSRNPERDYCLLLLMVRHGLRVSEACGLRLSDLDLPANELYVRRLKRGKPATHPLHPGEPEALQAWLKARAAMNPDIDALFV